MWPLDSRSNFVEIGSEKSPLVTFGLRPIVTANIANSLFSFFLLTSFSDFKKLLHNSKILPINFLD